MSGKKSNKSNTKSGIKNNDTQFPLESDDSKSFEEILPEEIIHSGKILRDTYVLLLPIGCGNNAKVWMTYEISTDVYRAMKIQNYECYDDGKREVNILKKIGDLANTNNTKNISNISNTDNHCIKMLDFFIYEHDSNVKFVCSVYELYAGSIQMLLSSGKYKYGLPIPVVKSITKQLVQAIAFLHSTAEVIHTDIKPENILFRGTPVSHQRVIEIFEKSSFKTKYSQLKKAKYETKYDKFIVDRDRLAIECVCNLQFLDETFEIRSSSTESEVESDESIIEGEDDFDESCDSDDSDNLDKLTKLTKKKLLLSDSSDSEENSDSDGSQSEEEINTRRQSVPDFVSFMQYKEKINIEKLYDFDCVLNNRENSADKVDLIDDKFVTNCCEIVLTDFGNSYFYKKRTEHEIQDRIYRSPEVILDFRYGYASDIWSIGCVVFELLTGFPLFNPCDEPLTKDIHHLFLLEKILGPIPVVMKKKSKRSKFLFDNRREYHIKNIESISRTSIRNILSKQHLFSATDTDKIAEFLSTILQHNPQKRITAKDMLNHPWLQ